MVYIDLASSRKRPAQDYTEAALSIDDLVFKFLLKHPHSEEFVSDLYDLLRNISVLCCESSLSASLSISKFHKQFLVAEKEIIKLSKDVYSIDLNRDFNRYVEEYKIPKNNLISHSSLNFILYFDDIAVNSPLGAFAKTGLQTHCAYKLILDPFNASSGALSNYRTYAFVKASIAKGTDKYKQFFLDCINSFLNSRIIIDNVEIGVKIHCVTGDHPVLQNLFGFKLNFRSIGKVGSCRACTIPNEKFSEFRTIESTEKYLRTNHDLEHLLPKYCNYVTDPHHDWSQGNVAVCLFGTINIFKIITQTSSEILVDSIKKLAGDFKCLKDINSILHPKFFDKIFTNKHDLNSLKKKDTYRLTGNQCIIITRMFFEYLKEIKNLLKTLLNISYILEAVELNADEIASRLKIYINEFFDNLHKLYKGDINYSMKLHIVLHSVKMIEIFGHPQNLSTRRFESSNGRVKKQLLISRNRINTSFTVIKKAIYYNILSSHVKNATENTTESECLRKSWVYDEQEEVVFVDEPVFSQNIQLELSTLEKNLEESFFSYEDSSSCSEDDHDCYY